MKELTGAINVYVAAKLPRILAIVKGGFVFSLANRVPELRSSPATPEQNGRDRKRDLPIYPRKCYSGKEDRQEVVPTCS